METQAASDRVVSATEFSLDTIDIISPDHYQKNGYPHAEWTYLRKTRPVFYVDRPRVDPFWAITKAADIKEISVQPRLWLNGPRLAAFPLDEGADGPPPELPLKHLLNMDPPQHGEYRTILSRYFTPRSVRALEPEVANITAKILDDVMDREQCDFVTEISSKVPVAVIAEMLGVPRPDWPTLFRWTNEIIGGGDPEFQRGKDANETFAQARLEMFTYFTNLVEERRKHPTGDVTSIIANAKIDGAPLPALELLSYLLVLVVAGNETTRNATSGGLLALIENPEQFRRLKSDPTLIKSAVEEIVRWTSPVIQFTRTATSDTVVRGQKIRAGESVCLFYPSANRDEDVFDQPFKFDIGRNPNPHLAFGIGEHFCLGSNLARLELEVIFRELAKRLERAESAGPLERLRSSFVGGIKHMPIRYKLKPAAAA
ncbi:MAG TPA: cytochrome P450 [Candidatus Binatus sp.]|uniref:cytochrome P450 n=1 Tax=Candidatus Binatus sp. TaxID=2811406 RepID=UPI002B48854D|nr:cytochrome P450 [Candidatus Binatus sp.]HKN15072.1 cytochrome P450 [Candidatus Binatus sp.]